MEVQVGPSYPKILGFGYDLVKMRDILDMDFGEHENGMSWDLCLSLKLDRKFGFLWECTSPGSCIPDIPMPRGRSKI